MIFYAKEEEMIEIRTVDDSGVLQPSGWFYLKYVGEFRSGLESHLDSSPWPHPSPSFPQTPVRLVSTAGQLQVDRNSNVLK